MPFMALSWCQRAAGEVRWCRVNGKVISATINCFALPYNTVVMTTIGSVYLLKGSIVVTEMILQVFDHILAG